MSVRLHLRPTPRGPSAPARDLDVDAKRLIEELVYGRIRCPLCGWQPSAHSLWTCESFSTPEPYFGGCGAMWNTFETRGVCPGCSHQWQWTSCHRCSGWSRHDEWYVRDDSDGA